MTYRKTSLACAAALCAVLTSQAEAAVVVNQQPGTLNVTTALTGFQTFGDDMVGMEVEAFFSDNTSESATWSATGSGAGSAVGSRFSLAESGDTFGGNWTLNNNATVGMTRLLIDAGPGDTVFDTTFGTNTPDSFSGLNFTLNSGPSGLDVVATYMDLVAIQGSPPRGDLFRRLQIEFTSRGNLAAGERIVYETDTDNLKFGGDLRPVPEPSTLAMGGLAALTVGLGLRSRRRKDVV